MLRLFHLIINKIKNIIFIKNKNLLKFKWKFHFIVFDIIWIFHYEYLIHIKNKNVITSGNQYQRLKW